MASIKNHHDRSIEQASDIEIFSRTMSDNTFGYAVSNKRQVCLHGQTLRLVSLQYATPGVDRPQELATNLYYLTRAQLRLLDSKSWVSLTTEERQNCIHWPFCFIGQQTADNRQPAHLTGITPSSGNEALRTDGQTKSEKQQ